MQLKIGRWITVLLAAALAAPLALPIPAAAQATNAFVDGAEAWTQSDCADDVPIVVGSDAAAQSDIYSAITLAGVIGTDCVILAGPRNGDMPPAQQARLEDAASGGYVVGGTVAVPAAKTAGRNMSRLAGADRWATAQLVGTEARSVGGGIAPSAPPLDTSLTAPDDVQQPGVHLRGAEPWIASDCTGDVPIVVGSDAKAQSDIYSAVTLAGVVGTGCVILAGPRDGSVPASQQARLDDAASGGYVVGGVAAVPTAKIAGRDMTRFAGANRWLTAQLVGRHASGDTTAGTSTADEPPSVDQPAAASTEYIAVSASEGRTCGLRADGTIACWRTDGFGEANVPSGKFTSVSTGPSHSCGLRTDGTIACWGENGSGQASAPSGTFTAVSAGYTHSCGARASGTVECWGNDSDGQVNAPSGKFAVVSAGYTHSCGVRTDGTVECWGSNRFGQADPPPRTFISVSAGGLHSCGLRTNGTVECWGSNADAIASVFIRFGQADPPSGKFTSVSAGWLHSCGVRTDGTVECWGFNGGSLAVFSTGLVSSRYLGQADAPLGDFTSVSAGATHSCGLRTDGIIECWGYRGSTALTQICGGRSDAPSGEFISVSAGRRNSCGVHVGGKIECWGSNKYGQSDAPLGEFTSVSTLDRHSCGVHANGSIECWGADIDAYRIDEFFFGQTDGAIRQVRLGLRRCHTLVRGAHQRHCRMLGLKQIRPSRPAAKLVYLGISRRSAFVRRAYQRHHRVLGLK